MVEKVMVSVVVPVFNEEEVIGESCKRLRSVLDGLHEPYELIFVNDGSRDKTLEMLRALAEQYPAVKVLSFSRNFGHQIAITAGMDYAAGEAVVVIDADLQDPPEVIPAMLERWKAGFHVVYGKRLQRKGETAFKLFTAKMFYRTLNAMTDVAIPVDTGDFRLIDRRVLDVLKSMPERNRYVRGLISWIGFNQTAVEYVREERFAGVTKYPLKKMLKLAGDGLTSFSYKPLKFASGLGVGVTGLSMLYMLIVLIVDILGGPAVSALHYMLGVVLLVQGLTLLLLGIGGEYLSRISDNVKGRPHYILQEKVGFDDGP